VGATWIPFGRETLAGFSVDLVMAVRPRRRRCLVLKPFPLTAARPLGFVVSLAGTETTSHRSNRERGRALGDELNMRYL
jgi:hypothetical protein